MSNEREFQSDEVESDQEELSVEGTPPSGGGGNGNGTRARNRTVMLTPEITNQVRSRYAQELEQLPPAAPKNTGFSPYSAEASHGQTGESSQDSGFYTPASRSRVNDTYFTPAPQLGGHSPASVPTQPYSQQPAPASQPRAVSGESVGWVKESPVIGFLVSYDRNPNGEVFELRVGRLIVTNQPTPNENVLVLRDDTVSSMHAILRISATAEIQVLDQLSEYGTKIKRFESEDEEILSGDKGSVGHGDTLSFGSRAFYVCLVPRRHET